MGRQSFAAEGACIYMYIYSDREKRWERASRRMFARSAKNVCLRFEDFALTCFERCYYLRVIEDFSVGQALITGLKMQI